MALPALALPSLPWKKIGLVAGAVALIVAVAVGVVYSIRSYGEARFEAGVLEERLVWETMVAEQEKELARRQRDADREAAQQRNEDERKIAQDRQEIDDAVAPIPDQSTSARQRARACIELRRQGQEPAACAVDAAD